MNMKKAEKISDVLLIVATIIMAITCVWFNME